MFKNPIMTQYQINFMHKTKKYWRVLFGSTLCQLKDNLRTKGVNPCHIIFIIIINVSIFSFSCCSGTHICSKTRKFKMPIKLDADATYVPMGIHDNSQEPLETNCNEVHNGKHATAP